MTGINRDTIDAIDDRIQNQKKKSPDPEEGIIVSVLKPICKVQVKGSTQLKTVRCDNSPDVDVGKRCLIQQIPRSKKYVIISVFASNNLPNNSTPQSSFELFPPNNIVVASNFGNAITVNWDTPPQQAVTFEVQTNTSAIDSGAVTAYLTRGSQLEIPSFTPLYIRVRSISQEFKYSAWSDWILGTPGVSIGTLVEPLCFDGEILFLAGDVLMIGVP